MRNLNDKKRVLLCGGTNFLGPHLIKKLVEKEYDVTVCTRGIHKVPQEDLVKTLVCDCNNDDEGTKKILGGMEFDVVIDCIAYCPKEVFNVLSNVKTSRYIQVSSIGVYQDIMTEEDKRSHFPIKEEDFDPKTYKEWTMEVSSEISYGYRKRYAECVAYQMFPQCNPISIRPAYVADPSNPAHEQNIRIPELISWISEGKAINPVNKNYAVCFTRVDEEADLIFKLMFNKYREPINISSAGYIEIKSIITYIAKKLGREYFYDKKGEYIDFPSGINLNIDRLTEIEFEVSKLSAWFWDYLDFYIKYPVRVNKPWKEIKFTIDTYQNTRYLECCELVGKQDVFVELCNDKNQSYEIFKFTALLMSKNICFGDILQYMGYTEIYVYGAGEIGHMLLDMLDERIKVKAVIDKDNIETIQFAQTDIMANELPIIVTPAAFFQEISYKLIKLGVARQRIHAIHTILTVAMKYIFSQESIAERETPYRQRKHFLITGAQFTNKGAQSMLFTAVSEIRKRFKNAIIWYLPLDNQIYTKEIQSRYDLLFLMDGYDLKSQLYEILTELTAIVDVSGYELSSHWDHGGWYLRILRFAYWYKIPLYLMPQSFGPFDFSDEVQVELKKYLPKVRHIFARELSAYYQMRDIYGLENISLSKDLVLQNKNLKKKYIYCENRNENSIKKLSTKSNVAIIPNERNYEFGYKEKVLEVYKDLLTFLLEKRKNIYIISHSGSGDQAICQNIYKKFKGDSSVHMVEKEMDCIEFEEFTSNFQYIIASRYHAIVHSYKKGVPCIVIGWADKYKALLLDFGQAKYYLDIRKKISKEEIYRTVCEMDKFFQIEREMIQKTLPSIQAENCFEILDEILLN